jgi:hypothetical protein
MSPEHERRCEAELLEGFPDLLLSSAAWTVRLVSERAQSSSGTVAPRRRSTVSRLRVRPGPAGSLRPKPVRVVLPKRARRGEER